MVYKHAFLNTDVHSPFMFSVVKMPLKGEVGGRALNGHGNYISDHGKSLKNHGIVFLNFCGNPAKYSFRCFSLHRVNIKSANQILVLIAHAQKPHLNTHAL